MVKIASSCLLVCLSVFVSAQPRNDYYQEDGLTPESIKRKGELLLHWSQELKATGLSLPSELYPTIVRARFSSIAKELDGFAHELSLLQDSPQALGTSNLSLVEFNGVGEKVEITQTYTVGMSLAAGAGILIAKHWQHDIHLQSDDEDLPNFVSVTTDNPNVRFKMNRKRGNILATGNMVYG